MLFGGGVGSLMQWSDIFYFAALNMQEIDLLDIRFLINHFCNLAKLGSLTKHHALNIVLQK